MVFFCGHGVLPLYCEGDYCQYRGVYQGFIDNNFDITGNLNREKIKNKRFIKTRRLVEPQSVINVD